MSGGYILLIALAIWIVSGISKRAKALKEMQEEEHSRPVVREQENPWDMDRPFSYDEDIEQEQVVNYDAMPVSPYEQPQFYSLDADKIEEPATVIEEKKPEASDVILREGFDLESAVIYSEILHPKYREY